MQEGQNNEERNVFKAFCGPEIFRCQFQEGQVPQIPTLLLFDDVHNPNHNLELEFAIRKYI